MKGTATIALAVVVIAVVFISGFSLLGEITAETNGKSYDYRGVIGNSLLCKVGDHYGHIDLLDASTYVTSWSGGGQSEKIVIQGWWITEHLLGPSFQDYWYKVTLTVGNPSGIQINGQTGTTWESEHYKATGGDSFDVWYPLKSIVLTITNPCSGMIHVDLWAHVDDLNPWSSDNGIIASDEAYLKDGIGKITVPTDVVEEGHQATITVTTGYSHTDSPGYQASDQGWYLSIFSPNGASVYQTTIGDNVDGYHIYYTVPTGSYSATGTNTYKVVLRNELINQDQAVFFVIGPGMTNKIPNKPEFKLISGNQPFVKGEQVTIQLSATKNPLGTDPTGFRVWVAYQTTAGSTTYYITGWENKFVTANGNGQIWTAEITFVVPESGSVLVSGSTVDSQNLNSGLSTYHMDVQNQAPNTNKPGGINWGSLFIGIIAMLAGIMFAYLALKYFPMKPWNFLVAVVFLLIGLVIAVLELAPILTGLG